MRLPLLLLLPLLAATTPAAASKDGPPIEFTRELDNLWAIAACGKPAPEGLVPVDVLRAHCADLDRIFGDYERRWATPARPFFAALVPKDAPRTVLYPFGGADLLTALAIYPDVADLTSISLEAGGDPRTFSTTPPKELAKHLALHRRFMEKLVTYNHSRTLDLGLLKGTPLPSQLIFALVGLKVHGYEPVGLRTVTLAPDGSIHYFNALDVALADEQAKDLKGSTRNRKLNDLFAGYELRFRKRGVESAPVQTYRHFQANLANDELAKDPRILRQIDAIAARANGRISAMTKAASYLLWWGNFTTIRQKLLEHAVWMVSDSTGPNPMHLDPSRWEQTTYGRFLGTFLKSSTEGIAALRALFEAQPARPLPFDYFGYPDNRKNGHLVVTRRR